METVYVSLATVQNPVGQPAAYVTRAELLDREERIVRVEGRAMVVGSFQGLHDSAREAWLACAERLERDAQAVAAKAAECRRLAEDAQ